MIKMKGRKPLEGAERHNKGAKRSNGEEEANIRDVLGLVDVDVKEDRVRVLGSESIVSGRNALARATPLGGEIDHNLR